MNSRSRRKFINEYKLRLHREFAPWIEEINEMLRAGVEHYRINNKLVDIRNKCCDFLDLCLFEITSVFEHKKVIKGSLKLNFGPPPKSYGKPCQICGERRVYNVCHVIPREEGGPKGSGNIIFLCPTHHFLFDHARLSKEEFENIDKSGLYPEVKEYIEKILSAKHEMRWKYQTNRFKGCNCGSREFEFKCHREEYSVEIVLVCKNCNATWMNLWEDMHPISQLKTIVYDLNTPKSEVVKILDAAEKKIVAFLNNIDEMLKSSKW